MDPQIVLVEGGKVALKTVISVAKMIGYDQAIYIGNISKLLVLSRLF